MTKIQAFISVSLKNEKTFAENLYNLLDQQTDVSAWICTKSIQKGEIWQAEIAKAVTKATHFFVLLSADWLNSNECQEEFNFARRRYKKLGLPKIIPLVLDDRLEDEDPAAGILLANYNGIFMGNQEQDWEKKFPEILECLGLEIGNNQDSLRQKMLECHLDEEKPNDSPKLDSNITKDAAVKLDLHNPQFSDGFWSAGQHHLPPKYAIDDCRHPDDFHFAHSKTQNSVFTVELSQMSHVTQAIIFPRMNGCYERYKNMKVRVGQQLGRPVGKFTAGFVLDHKLEGLKWKFSAGQAVDNKIIVENSNDYIQISEIEVYGMPMKNAVSMLKLISPKFSDGFYPQGAHHLPPEYAIDGNCYPDDFHFAHSNGKNKTFTVKLAQKRAKLHHVIIWPRQQMCYERYESMTVETDKGVRGKAEAKFTAGYVLDHRLEGLKWTFPEKSVCSKILVKNPTHAIQISEIRAFGKIE